MHSLVSMRVHAIPQSHCRGELDRSTLDLDSRQKRQSDVSVTGLTRQYRSVWYVARVCVLYIALASFIYTRDYVSQKNA